MPVAWIMFLAYLSYGIPSVLLYFLTLFIVIRHRKTFDSSFFQLYCFDGLMNLFTYTVGYLKTRLSSITCYHCVLALFYRNIGNCPSLLNFVMCMNYHMAYVQYAITSLISLNRLSVLLKFNTCEPLWRKYTWLLVLAIFLFPFCNTRCVFMYTAEIVYLNESDSYNLVSKQLPASDIFSVLIPFMIVIILISVAANVASLIIVGNINNSQTRNKAEVNFIVIMSITCLVQLIGTVLSVATLKLSGTPAALVLAKIVPFVSDGLTLVQPWLLIGFSHAVREKARLMFASRWSPKKHSVSVVARSATF
ncbi:unnamed protein product [Caenorhabditis sp. 36 PRJEB53466]|nr:unnamed protein product [Caenorhabditis sp. 36 PRJEB53466]